MATEILDLYFRLMTEKTFSHSMDSSLLISDVKALIETESEIAPENQRLIFKGQLLKDEYTLQSYGLKSGNTIHVVGRVISTPAPEPSESTSDANPNSVTEPDSTSDNNTTTTTNTTQNATQGPEQNPEGQATTGTSGGRGFGYPMGIFMSPIYATISVSGQGNPQSENAMEQVASQFFSGVVNSLLTSFNNGPGSSTNTPTTRQEPAVSRTPEEELLVDLELSTSMLNRVTRSVKRLNNTPRSPTPSGDNANTNSNNNNTFTPNITTSVSESLDSTGDFNNLLSTTGNVDHENFRQSSQTNTPRPQVVTINLDRENQNTTTNSNNNAPSVSEYEEFEGRGGKVLLIDPEVLSSKLPWESLNKLEQVLFENDVESNSYDDFSQSYDGFVVTEEFHDVIEGDLQDDISSRVPVVDIGVESNTNQNNNNNLEEFSEVVEIKVEDVTEKTKNEILGYEEFMNKFHSYELRLNDIMRDYNMGDKMKQLDRFKQLSSAMAIKTRIDVSLCALFSWMQTQMVSTERARAFATNMGWNSSTSTTTTNNNNTMQSTSPETPVNESEVTTSNNTVPVGNSFVNSATNTTTTNNNNVGFRFVNTGTLGSNNNSGVVGFGVGQVTVEIPVNGSGIGVSVSSSGTNSRSGSISGSGLNPNNLVTSTNNPFNAPINNPFVNSNTVSPPFSTYSSNESNTTTNNNNNNSENTSNPEINFQQSNSDPSFNESLNTSSNQSDLFSRYRNNPDFSINMSRIRQTRLSDSYYGTK